MSLVAQVQDALQRAFAMEEIKRDLGWWPSRHGRLLGTNVPHVYGRANPATTTRAPLGTWKWHSLASTSAGARIRREKGSFSSCGHGLRMHGAFVRCNATDFQRGPDDQARTPAHARDANATRRLWLDSVYGRETQKRAQNQRPRATAEEKEEGDHGAAPLACVQMHGRAGAAVPLFSAAFFAGAFARTRAFAGARAAGRGRRRRCRDGTGQDKRGTLGCARVVVDWWFLFFAPGKRPSAAAAAQPTRRDTSKQHREGGRVVLAAVAVDRPASHQRPGLVHCSPLVTCKQTPRVIIKGSFSFFFPFHTN